VNNELVKLWKEMVTLYFQLRSHHSSDGTQNIEALRNYNEIRYPRNSKGKCHSQNNNTLP